MHVKTPLSGSLWSNQTLKKNLHVLKRHYRALKCHYRALKNCMELEFMELEFQNFYFILFYFLVCYNSIIQKLSLKLKIDFEKIEFQNMGIFLISLENGAKRWFFCTKMAFAHFGQTFNVNIWIQIHYQTRGGHYMLLT